MELALATPGKKGGSEKISLSDEAFGRDFNEPLVHQTVVTFLAGARQGSVKSLKKFSQLTRNQSFSMMKKQLSSSSRRIYIF